MSRWETQWDSLTADMTTQNPPWHFLPVLCSLQQLSFNTFHRKTLMVRKQITIAVSLSYSQVWFANHAHLHTTEVSKISNRPVLICIKIPKTTQDEKTEEQRNYIVPHRLTLNMTGAKISLVRALPSRPCYKPTVRANNSRQEVFIMHFN